MTSFGIGLYPNVPVGRLVTLAELAERTGFATVWVPDSHLLWREAYVTLGAMAQATRRVRLATAVTNPSTRRITVTASAASTLAELSGGRAILGISVGDSALRSEGLAPATVGELEHRLGQLRDLLDGSAVSLTSGGTVRLGHAERVPVYVAATGPRMLDLAGRLADGVILMNGVAPRLVGAAIDRVRAAATHAGRSPGEVRTVVWAASSLSDEQPTAALDAVKYNVARTIMRRLPGVDQHRLEPLVARIRAKYDYRQHGSSAASFAALVPDDVVQEFAFAGTSADVAAQIAALRALGVDEIAFALPDATGCLDQSNVMRRLAELLAPDVDRQFS